MTAARARAAAILFVVAIVASGCGSGTPSPTTPAATTQSSAGSGPAELCNATPGVACTFNAGLYKSTKFEGGLSLQLVGDNAWTNKANAADVVILTIGGDGGFGSSGDPSSIVFVHGAPKLTSGATADGNEAKTRLGNVSGLKVTAVAGAVIDGQAGATFRVSNTSAETISLWQYPATTGAGSYDLPGGASAEIHWLSIGGAPVIVAFMSPGNTLDAFVLDSDPTIRSIHFGT